MFIPQPAWSNIMSYLHSEYDWERKAVIVELKQKCALFGDDFDFIEFVPSLLLPTRSMMWNAQWYYIQAYIDSYHFLDRIDIE